MSVLEMLPISRRELRSSTTGSRSAFTSKNFSRAVPIPWPGEIRGKSSFTQIRRNHHPGEFGLIEKLFDVVQRDGAEKLFIFPDDVDILQPVLHEGIRNLSEGRIVRERDRVASNKIDYFRVGQLLVEECRSFAFERFSINELLFENAAAVVGNDAINHQERRKRVVESEFEGHQDRHQWRAGGRRDKRSHAHDTAHPGIQLKTRERHREKFDHTTFQLRHR